MDKNRFFKNNIFGLFILFIVILLILSGLYADWLWFDSLGYLSIYKTVLFSKIALGFIVFIVFLSFLLLNFLIIRKRVNITSKKIYLLIIFIISILAGFISSTFWFVVLKFLNFTELGFVDPIFKNDIAFYIFTLPFYNYVLSTLLILITVITIMTAATYILSNNTGKTIRSDPKQNTPFSYGQRLLQIKVDIPKKIRIHLALLIGLLLLIFSAFFYLKRFSILFSPRGAVFGAGFTDVTIILPLYSILALVTLLMGFIAFAHIFIKNIKLLIGGIVFIFILSFAGNIVAGLVQSLYVEPNEFNLEEQYIGYNIEHTLFAYGLSDVKTKDFPVTYDLDINSINKNKATIDNVRLWDWKPLLTTNKQIQLFRTYYEFLDVDVDRYKLNEKVVQLMISPRELDQNQLDIKARTWVNKKFVYTHGYGVVVSPVNKVSSDGLPELFVKDIPPKTEFDELKILQPRIYFGEQSNDFIIVNSKTKEFDYPLGNENKFTIYNGTDGIQLSNILTKGILSLRLGSLNMFISSAITKDSKVLFNRDIIERTTTLAPFIKYDSDPYIVIDNGKLFWIIDAYTVTNKFPYSETTLGINYIRNSVKVVVDAFNGNVDFYVLDNDDPLIKNYAKIFPELFKNLDDMPDGLKEHIRYPEDLMRIQTEVYGTYHMENSQVFYNREDVWRTPKEIYSNNEIELRPYYVVFKLPGAEKVGFFLITPLVPRGKQNMIAWFVAHSDPEDYGKLEVFKLSKQELIYGPMQIEARIDQDTEISQLLTLWGQQGSEVIRGNLIILPIEESFLYIEPIYLKASASGALPQLKRVIVAYGDEIAMEKTLEEALTAIFKGKIEEVGIKTKEILQEKIPKSLSDKFNQASILYDEAQEALTQGNLIKYAEKIEELGRIFDQKNP